MKKLRIIRKFMTKLRGTTIVELLVYMGLLSIFLLVLTQILISALNIKLESESYTSVEEDGRFITARLSNDINRANSIISPSPIGVSSNTLTLSINGTIYTYALSETNLELTNDLGSNNLNSSESIVSNPSFLRIGNSAIPNSKDTIKISFTLNSKTKRIQGSESKTFETTVGLR
ncbi:hypothetical protein A3F02_03005 [Candidatus Curtissbacteria bacterium RIFCSPHIGHO2_12_FULL_38_9b]|uniref:Uncharacterized protein n=1 Tax=Candidatus Curtissbacteria bacterium RIFCSPHIGHO2_12_FULL_38_9b TaxID=1797720 RepID=A0A1F5GZA9_9BACT|nr:MAG: hypothetical protein A3F02_03005 [Candidatus Curtissbacteria bacterium RIFCSPHIGHO2_12_FULL_38_9b]